MAHRRPQHIKPPRHLSKSRPVSTAKPAREEQEAGGPKGKEPTRYGDWENNGICIDF